MSKHDAVSPVDYNGRMKSLASELAGAFVEKVRPRDGSKFITIVDAAQDTWIQSAVRKAHAGAMPDDIIYRMCKTVAEELNELNNLDVETQCDDEQDDFQQRIESLVPTYYDDLKAWLLNPNADLYLEQAVKEGYFSFEPAEFKFFEFIAAGCIAQLQAIATAFLEAIRVQVDQDGAK